MDDGPPPRKKSRFFSAGKSKFDSLFPSRRKSEGGSPSLPTTANNDDKHAENEAQHHEESALPRTPLSLAEASLRKIRYRTDDEEPGLSRRRARGGLSPIKEDGVESNDDGDGQNQRITSKSPTPPFIPRNTRRQGIYGIGNLTRDQQPYDEAARARGRHETLSDYQERRHAEFEAERNNVAPWEKGNWAYRSPPNRWSRLAGLRGSSHSKFGGQGLKTTVPGGTPRTGHVGLPLTSVRDFAPGLTSDTIAGGTDLRSKDSDLMSQGTYAPSSSKHPQFTIPSQLPPLRPRALSLDYSLNGPTSRDPRSGTVNPPPGLTQPNHRPEWNNYVNTQNTGQPSLLPQTPRKKPTIDPIKRTRPPATQLVDLDRDSHGQPLPISQIQSHLRPNPLVPRPPSLMPRDNSTPQNFYTSPHRLVNARLTAFHSLKRKRPLPALPPQSYIYTRTNDPDFNIFHGLLLYPELTFAFAAHVPVRELISLYAISKDFHTIIDTRFTTVILSQARAKARESARIFPFRSYAHLCRSDPAAIIPHPNPAKRALGLRRMVPSFRWLQMVLFREKVIHEIMGVFAEDGVPMPRACVGALRKIWYVLDIPDNARRIGFVHGKQNITDLELYFAMCVTVKLDMLCNDPVTTDARSGVRKLVLGSRSLSTLLRVVKREEWMRKVDLLGAWLRYQGEITAEERAQGVKSVFGIPVDEVGRGRLEYWGKVTEEQLGREPQILLRPDMLLVREAVRRGLRFHRHFFRCMLYGYVEYGSLEDYRPREEGRRIRELEVAGEYQVDDEVGGVVNLGEGMTGYDELLDLGGAKKTGMSVVASTGLKGVEREKREAEEKFLDECKRVVEMEMEEARLAALGDGEETADGELDEMDFDQQEERDEPGPALEDEDVLMQMADGEETGSI